MWAVSRVRVSSASLLRVSARCAAAAAAAAAKPAAPAAAAAAAAAAAPVSASGRHFKLLVVGGGTAGAAVSNAFARLGKSLCVVEPHTTHSYQPLWTLVGSGVAKFEDSQRPESSVLPKDVTWEQTSVSAYDPENNSVKLASGESVTYDYLVVASGLVVNHNGIKGFMDAVGKDGVASNYLPTTVTRTVEFVKALKEGTAVFALPAGPMKCAGAPQKALYMSEDRWRKMGVRDKINVQYFTAGGDIFGVPKYAAALRAYATGRDIGLHYGWDLTEVNAAKKEATFTKVGGSETKVVKYDFLHSPPKFSAPAELKASKLADQAGFCEVDRHTLQHVRYSNVFSLGDSSSLPTSKTAAAISSQMGVLKRNLADAMDGRTLTAKYDGYTSCPLTMHPGKLLLMEFGYDGSILETFPVDQATPRALFYLLKTHVFPPMYWNALVKGLWEGPAHFRNLSNIVRKFKNM